MSPTWRSQVELSAAAIGRASLSRVRFAVGTTAKDLIRSAGSFGYGFVAQSCAAATSFGLVVVAAHALGPGGLGTMFVGFAAYLVLIGFERGLLTDPLIANSAARSEAERAATARFCLTLAALAAVAAGAVLALAGALIPAQFGRGMILFAPWLVPAMLEDTGRSILFRDGRGRSAALADAAWLLTMVATAPIAIESRSDWAVAGCWGAGAAVGAAVALVQIRWRPAVLRDALNWWKSEAWEFGRWLAVGGTLYSVASYTSVLALAGILGARDYGGLRAVQSVFAPLTLIGPAIALTGFPLVSRLLAISARRALATAAKLAAVITAVTGGYVVTLYAFPSVLALVFGQKFVEFRSIIVPIGVAQLVAAPWFGFTLFFKAQQRGRTLLWLLTLNAFLFLAFSVSFGSLFGLTGAAWAGAAAGALGGIAWIIALRQAIKGHLTWPQS
jgi:O-antigen/teichoic acid export membrane protein